MDIKLSALEAGLLARAAARTAVVGMYQLSATALSPAEKAACKRLVKKGYMQNIMDTFYKATDAGRERAARST